MKRVHCLCRILLADGMHRPCGRENPVANGLLASCYTLKRQDAKYFGGLREAVLERHAYCCRLATPLVDTSAR